MHHTHCPKCDRNVSGEAPIFCVGCRFPLKILNGKYRFDLLLGEGGFGVIYLVSNLEDDGMYVIKKIKSEAFEDEPDMDRRFRREIRLTREISQLSPHVIEIYEDGEDEDIGHYYVMEFLNGESLAELMRPGKSLPLQTVFHIFRQLCDGVEAAHKQGVIHRDIKPDNVFLVPRGGDPHFVKLLDFGIAKPPQNTLGGASMTRGMIGSPNYMPPEQFTNENLSHRADIYALGCMLYHMLTGHIPFEGNITKLMFAHLQTMPPSLHESHPEAGFSQGLEVAVAKAMAKKPEERFASVAELWAAIEADALLEGVVHYASGEPLATEIQPQPGEPTRNLKRDIQELIPTSQGDPPTVPQKAYEAHKHRALTLVLGLVILALLGAVIALLLKPG